VWYKSVNFAAEKSPGSPNQRAEAEKAEMEIPLKRCRAAGLVAGLQPVTFVSMAAPHLGIAGLMPKTVERLVSSPHQARS